MSSLGATPHFGRPSSDQPRLSPAGVVVALRLELPVLDRRSTSSDPRAWSSRTALASSNPSATSAVHAPTTPDVAPLQDYSTVGHLYRGIRNGLESLSDRLGERALFLGQPLRRSGGARSPSGDLEVSDRVGARGRSTPSFTRATLDEPRRLHYSASSPCARQYVAAAGRAPRLRACAPRGAKPVMRHPSTSRGGSGSTSPSRRACSTFRTRSTLHVAPVLVEAFGSGATPRASAGPARFSIDLMRLDDRGLRGSSRACPRTPLAVTGKGISFAMVLRRHAVRSARGVEDALSAASSSAGPPPRAGELQVFNGACERLHHMATRFATLIAHTRRGARGASTPRRLLRRWRRRPSARPRCSGGPRPPSRKCAARIWS